MAWDRKRLEDTVRERLAGAKLIAVANREPYIHNFADGGIECLTPASGLVTALDPVMRACGGSWVAHGGGDADRVTADASGRAAVPPGDPRYVLRRVWLTKEEEEGYYYGFSNDALWPLCHIVHHRPRFDPADWERYRAVNRKFAAAVLDELDDRAGIVFVQDYHFALLPRMLKDARPDLVVIQFWHIPWPNREACRICPWKQEIIDGLLGNDILAFHIQYHCNNFLDTCDRAVEAPVDWERFSVTRGGKTTVVRPQAISIDPDDRDDHDPAAAAEREQVLRRRLSLGTLPLLVGVDRVDYTKGIPERLRAVDRLLTLHPEFEGKFRFVQIGAPSRTHLPAYRRLGEEIEDLADEINLRHGNENWRPIAFVHRHHGAADIRTLYRAAAGCVVSSLHDGMNLVAKEFVAARADLRGCLILSQFTGAARELTEALLMNPYSVDEFAESLRTALTMPAAEQERRMRLLRRQVEDNNVWRWAGMLLSDAAKVLHSRPARPARSAPDDFPPTEPPLTDPLPADSDPPAPVIKSLEFRPPAPINSADAAPMVVRPIVSDRNSLRATPGAPLRQKTHLPAAAAALPSDRRKAGLEPIYLPCFARMAAMADLARAWPSRAAGCLGSALRTSPKANSALSALGSWPRAR